MTGLHIERHLDGGGRLAHDIAHHLKTRQLHGGVVVVAGDPATLLAGVRREWRRIAETLAKSDAATTRQLSFVAGAPPQHASAGVYFCRADELFAEPPTCHTLYVAVRLDEQTVDRLTSRMPDHGLVVLYEQRVQHPAEKPVRVKVPPSIEMQRVVLGPFQNGEKPRLTLTTAHISPPGSLDVNCVRIGKGRGYNLVYTFQNWGTETVVVTITRSDKAT